MQPHLQARLVQHSALAAVCSQPAVAAAAAAAAAAAIVPLEPGTQSPARAIAIPALLTDADALPTAALVQQQQLGPHTVTVSASAKPSAAEPGVPAEGGCLAAEGTEPGVPAEGGCLAAEGTEPGVPAEGHRAGQQRGRRVQKFLPRKSALKGVSWDKRSGHKKVRFALGYFDTPEEGRSSM
ncbi:hypothetical protein OEZ86_005181 [Tetradesmus obliquus]|nr:hypothetical protein OEZ86_005181 [Tetradesmus obliquus]